MDTRKRNIIFGIIAVVLIGAGIFLFRDSLGMGNKVSLAPREGEVRIEGAIVCLPARDPAASLGCVKGVQGGDGTIYALNTSDIGWIEEAVDEGQQVTVVGVYEPADTAAEESNVFLYDGVIVVRLISE